MKKQNKDAELLSSIKSSLLSRELPEGLSKDNIISAAAGGAQTDTKVVPLEYGRNKRIKKIVATAAVFAIVVSSIAVAKPWKNNPAPINTLAGTTAEFGDVDIKKGMQDNGETSDATDPAMQESSGIQHKEGAPSRVDDYGVIEALFLEYAGKLKERYTLYNTNSAVDYAIPGTGTPTAAPGNDAAEVPAVDSFNGSGDHGSTNIQVSGVDEADILKNDGRYLYAVSVGLGQICIIDPKPDAMKILCEFSTGSGRVRDIYVSGNTLIAMCANEIYDYNGNVITAVIYDISDRTAPVRTGVYSQQGSPVSTRLTNGKLIILSSYNGYSKGYDEQTVRENCIPEAGANGKMTRVAAEDICVLPDAVPGSYLIATKIDIAKGVSSAKTVSVLGGGSHVYCTNDTLYAVKEQYIGAPWNGAADLVFRGSDFKTEIYAFSISGSDISFIASGKVDGTVLNQFSMDEYNGYLRIATNHSSSDGKITNNVFVLNKSLEIVGSLKGIAPGETIMSARFTGNKAYLVTFLNTDPLFVIDLSVPTAPAILGELKIPGFSSYLHPISDTLLVGIGPDGSEAGRNGYLKVSMFDVSDPAKPVEISKYVMRDGLAVRSEAYGDPKAFTFDASRGIVMFPVTQYNDVGVHSYYTALSVDIAAKSFGSAVKYQSHNRTKDDIIRGTYIGDTVYTLSYSRLCAFDRAAATQLSEVVFTGGGAESSVPTAD